MNYTTIYARVVCPINHIVDLCTSHTHGWHVESIIVWIYTPYMCMYVIMSTCNNEFTTVTEDVEINVHISTYIYICHWNFFCRHLQF